VAQIILINGYLQASGQYVTIGFLSSYCHLSLLNCLMRAGQAKAYKNDATNKRNAEKPS
jgi:hypothetical protein